MPSFHDFRFYLVFLLTWIITYRHKNRNWLPAFRRNNFEQGNANYLINIGLLIGYSDVFDCVLPLFPLILPDQLRIGSFTDKVRAFSISLSGKSTIGAANMITIIIIKLTWYISCMSRNVINRLSVILILPNACRRTPYVFGLYFFNFLFNTSRCILWNI